MASAQDDLDLVIGLAHIENQTSNALARLVLLAGDLLAPRHESLGTTDRHHQRPAFVALGHAGYQFADTLDEFVVDAGPLVFAEPLDDDLLGRLGRNSAEALQGDRFVTATNGKAARDPIEFTGELLGIHRVEVLACGRDHRLLDIGIERFLVDIAVARDRIDQSQHFLGVHEKSPGSIFNCRARSSLPWFAI